MSDDGTCACGHDHDKGIAGVTAPVQSPYLCNCGCLELRERVVLLESNLYQLSLIVQNKEKAAGEPQPPKRRYIGDTGA